jgi:HAD superfamily hydrolase (TIGR01662 family)
MEMSWDIVRLHHNIEVPFDEYKKQIGKPFFDILDELGITEKQQQIKNTYDEASNMVIDEVEIYEGAIETLQHIKDKGYKIAICTSKDIVRVKKVIASLILDGKKFPMFDYICSPKRGLRGKPAPDQLLNTIAFCNVDPHETFYVGDMESDYHCANRAGVDFIHASYGYGEFECSLKIQSIKAIKELLD